MASAAILYTGGKDEEFVTTQIGPKEAEIKIKADGTMDLKLSNKLITNFKGEQTFSTHTGVERGTYFNFVSPTSESKINKNIQQTKFIKNYFNHNKIGSYSPMTCYMPYKNMAMSYHTHPYCQNQNTKENFYVFTLPSENDITFYFEDPYIRPGKIHFVVDALGYYVLCLSGPPYDRNKLIGIRIIRNITEEFKKVETSYERPGNRLALFYTISKNSNDFETIEKVKKLINDTIDRVVANESYKPFQHFKFYLFDDPPPVLKNIRII